MFIKFEVIIKCQNKKSRSTQMLQQPSLQTKKMPNRRKMFPQMIREHPFRNLISLSSNGTVRVLTMMH